MSVVLMKSVATLHDAAISYHDSCNGLRQLGIREQPRKLLYNVHGLQISEMKDSDVCCGFGGTFCVKYPDISGRMVADKADHIADTGVGTGTRGRSRLPAQHCRTTEAHRS
jgi:L-lactate dehydrogenase complex protein LldE